MKSFSLLLLASGVLLPAAELPTVTGDVTFSKDIAPILQRSCQNCHQPNSVAPMSLITYAAGAAMGEVDQGANAAAR